VDWKFINGELSGLTRGVRIGNPVRRGDSARPSFDWPPSGFQQRSL
jgi:hypothetical protein